MVGVRDSHHRSSPRYGFHTDGPSVKVIDAYLGDQDDEAQHKTLYVVHCGHDGLLRRHLFSFRGHHGSLGVITGARARKSPPKHWMRRPRARIVLFAYSQLTGKPAAWPMSLRMASSRPAATMRAASTSPSDTGTTTSR